MASPDIFLINSERLISDAGHLFADGRTRSAATLMVVALEQMGAFVEALTREEYPDAELHAGIFGDKVSSHAKRQDALAEHVMNYTTDEFMAKILVEAFLSEHAWNEDHYKAWLDCRQLSLTEKQQQQHRESAEVATGHLLMRLTRTNQLKELREYGLHENTGHAFSKADVKQIIDLAARVRTILARSFVVSGRMKLAEADMPGFVPITLESPLK